MKSRTAPTKIPITLLTGFLGSGKTTLLNQLLKTLASATQVQSLMGRLRGLNPGADIHLTVPQPIKPQVARRDE